MATVRFSQDLIEKIKASARGKMHPAIERASATRPNNTWGQRIYDTLFLEVKPLAAQLPDGWLNTIDKFTIDKVGDLQCDLDFTFVVPQPWPNKFPVSDLAKKEYSYRDSIVLKDHAVWSDFKQEVADWKERMQAAKQRQTEFVEMVSKVVNAHSTLAPALKVWPPLWDLIPEDYKERHREIKVRDKVEVAIDVDLSKLTALSTAAKFGV